MLPIEIYYDSLEHINGIRFTPREVDIIACILNGRSAKTIPSLLSIAPKTVSAHLENIRARAGCTTRESIIDFIEKSDKNSLIKNEYYSRLLTYNRFQQILREISKKIAALEKGCLLVYKQEEGRKSLLLPTLACHLKLVGFKVKSNALKEEKLFHQLLGERDSQHTDHVLYIIPDMLARSQQRSDLEISLGREFTEKTSLSLERLIFIDFNENLDETVKPSGEVNYVNFSKTQSYYLAFCEILKVLVPHSWVNSMFVEFKQQTEIRDRMLTHSSPLTVADDHLEKNKVFLNNMPTKLLTKRIAYLSVGLLLFSGAMFCYAYLGWKKSPEKLTQKAGVKNATPIRSDLIIPAHSTLLNRPELIAQINEKFKESDGIQTVALVGIGGAGKTTLARLYAQQQKENIIWEINADTRSHLDTSFENLGAALSITPEDKREFQALQDIKNVEEREEKLIQCVKRHLKNRSGWLLIFDNVGKLSDIQKYFPQDSNTWGRGKIILTSRDYNLHNNNQIDHVLCVGELDSSQSLSLFSKIMNHGEIESFTSAQEAEAKLFLEKLPAFPLDISVAAYYLKVANISYSEYLENVKKSKDEFDQVQANIIKEFGNYSKTRYGIITLSLQEIITASKDFIDLLLFISLIDAQDIPKELLAIYKNNIIVDNFVFHLKKYSLVMNNPLYSSFSLSSFSSPSLTLHQSTQDILLAYLSQLILLEKGSQLLNSVANIIDDYVDNIIEQEDFLKMKIMVRHLEKLLKHENLLTDFSKGLLESKLGSLYYFINNTKAKDTLEDSLTILQGQNIDPLSSAERSRLARSLAHIGVVYTELRFDKKAEELFKKAINIYKKEGIKKYADLSWALAHLGNVHRRQGNYEQARDYLERSIDLHQKYGIDKKRIACTLAYLGVVYRKLGGYQKATESLEKSLALYKTNSPHEYFREGWILIQLGNVYGDLGQEKKAKEYLENGLLILKEHLPENHLSLGLVLAYLGKNCRKLGEYENSHRYLLQSLKIYEEYSDEEHLRIGWVLFNLAHTYKEMGKNQEAQELFNKVLKIYPRYCITENLKTARLLRDMAGVYIENNLLDEATNFIKQSLKILQERNHVDTYKSLEVLGEIYLKQSSLPFYEQNAQERQALKTQAINIFKEALYIVEQNFPDGSSHREKIANKIQAAR